MGPQFSIPLNPFYTTHKTGADSSDRFNQGIGKAGRLGSFGLA